MTKREQKKKTAATEAAVRRLNRAVELGALPASPSPMCVNVGDYSGIAAISIEDLTHSNSAGTPMLGTLEIVGDKNLRVINKVRVSTRESQKLFLTEWLKRFKSK